MAAISRIVLILVAIFAANVDAINVTETKTSQSASSGITELTVNSQLKGNIIFHSNDNGASVRFVITKFGVTMTDINNVAVVFQDSSSHLSLSLSYGVASTSSYQTSSSTRPLPSFSPTPAGSPTPSPTYIPTPTQTASSQRLVANFFISLIGVFIAGVTFQSSRLLFIMLAIFVSSGLLYSAIAQEDMTSVDVHIYVPRNFRFKSVSLISLKGTVKVDTDLIALNKPLTCSTGNLLETCPSCCSGNGNCTNGVCSCVIGYQNGTNNCSQQTNTTLHFFSHPSDPYILGANTLDGDVIYAIGEKNSEGIPTKVERFQLNEPDGNTTYTRLNENNTITSARHSSGMTMNFNWTDNDTAVDIIVYVPETSQSYVISINLTQNITNITEFNEFNSLVDEEQNRRKRDVNEIHNPINKHVNKRKVTQRVKKHNTRIRRNAQPASSARISVDVTYCNMPSNNAIVLADVTQGDRTYPFNSQLSNSTAGRYYIDIPTETDFAAVAGDACDAIEMALSTACDWYDKTNTIIQLFTKQSVGETACFYLGKGLQLIPQLKFFPIYKFCKLIFKGVDYYCDKINAEFVPGGPKRSELICDLITEVVDRSFETVVTTVHIVPSATFITGEREFGTGRNLTLPAGQSEVSLPFDIMSPGITRYLRITVTPPNPAVGSTYSTTVYWECYADQTIRFRITSSNDGFLVDENTNCNGLQGSCTISNVYKDGTYHYISSWMTSPGGYAEPSIHETIYNNN